MYKESLRFSVVKNGTELFTIEYPEQVLIYIEIKDHKEISGEVRKEFIDTAYALSKSMGTLFSGYEILRVDKNHHQRNPFNPMDHIYHDGCDDPDCNGGCPLCTLSVCKICGAYEGGLTTHCPGIGASTDDQEEVYHNKKDFRAGKWRQGLSTRFLFNNLDYQLEQELQYLQQLNDEDAGEDFIIDSLMFIEELKCVKRDIG